MISIKNLFRHGPGPSSTYSIHPYRLAIEFKDECKDATTIKVTLYGKLKDNADENFTVQALKNAISPYVARIITDDESDLPDDVIALKFQSFGKNKVLLREELHHITKLGEVSEIEDPNIPEVTAQDLIDWAYDNGRTVWEFALKCDSSNLEEYISLKWSLMKKSIAKGLEVEGGLPNPDLGTRRASLFLSRSIHNRDFIQQISKTLSYSLAVIEENASAKSIVAAPTAKSCGVIPGVLYELMETYKVSETRIIRGLITAGMIGKLLYKDIQEGSIISDITIATSMASAAATQIMGGTPKQVIAAAAIALNDITADKKSIETDHLNYIELNALASSKAMDYASWALLSDKNITKEIDFFKKITMRL
ncbi:MAG: L-serine ammonia-lyase, iron-sulfur-dependent, subunit alpha [Spirochaetaceae bacterium]